MELSNKDGNHDRRKNGRLEKWNYQTRMAIMTAVKMAGLIQQFLFELPLKKTLLLTTGIAILLLSIVTILGVKQYLLYQHCNLVVTASKQLLFQFSGIKEHINEALIIRGKIQFKDIYGEIEDLESDIALFENDILIPENFKQGFITQIDLVGLGVKLRSVQETTDITSPEQLSTLTALLRSMYSRITQFHQGLSSYTQSLLLGLHKTLVGCLALTIFVVSTLLFLVNRSISRPILQLGQILRSFAARGTHPQTEQNKSIDISIHEIVNAVSSLSVEHLRLTEIFSAIDVYETLNKKSTSPEERWHNICSVLQTNADYCLVWVGTLLPKEELPQPVSACGSLATTEEGCLDILDHLIKYCKKNGGLCDSVSKTMRARTAVISRLFTSSLPESLHGLLPFTEDIFSSASFPIPSGDKVIAIITLYNPGHDCFKASEITLLSYFFNHLANQPEEHSPANLSSTPADNILSIQALSRIYRYSALGKLTTDISHELTDLSNGAINYTQALLDLANDQPQDMESKTLLDKLLTEEKKMSRLAVDLQHFSKDNNDETRRYTVQEIINNIVTLTKGQTRAEGIELQIKIAPSLPVVPKNGNNIQLIILSLIQNVRTRILAKFPAGKHDMKTIQITAILTQQASPNQIMITIQDHGTAWQGTEFNQNTHAPLLEPWLEMYQCRLFLQNFGGDLNVESGADHNNICTLLLPI